MMFGVLSSPSTFLPLVKNPIWRQAFDALHELDANSALGVRELQGKKMFINVHTYQTKPVDECRFEGHRRMIDLQYIIEGGELVEWELKSSLTEDGPYDAESDFQFYETPTGLSGTSVHLSSGCFGVFFEHDGHRPQINDQVHNHVLKAVVKIDASLLKNNMC